MNSDVTVKTEGTVVSVFFGETEQTRIDVDDPGSLEFEYMQQMDIALQCAMPGSIPIRAAHIGGCGCALAWAWEVSRPGSRQLAVEVDARVAEQARTWFPLPRKPALRIRVGDGRDVLKGSQATFDVIVRDAFAEATVPRHLQTVQWAKTVRSHLQTGGVYLANCSHGAGTNSRGDVAAVRDVFEYVLLVAPSKVLKGARWGNIVMVAWNQPELIDERELDRRLRRLPLPVSVLAGKEIERWLGGAQALTDPTSEPQPGLG